MLIFVASGTDHSELKFPDGNVGDMAAGQFVFEAGPSVRVFGLTGGKCSIRRHGVTEPNGGEAVTGGTLIAEKRFDEVIFGALDN